MSTRRSNIASSWRLRLPPGARPRPGASHAGAPVPSAQAPCVARRAAAGPRTSTHLTAHGQAFHYVSSQVPGRARVARQVRLGTVALGSGLARGSRSTRRAPRNGPAQKDCTGVRVTYKARSRCPIEGVKLLESGQRARHKRSNTFNATASVAPASPWRRGPLRLAAWCRGARHAADVDRFCVEACFAPPPGHTPPRTQACEPPRSPEAAACGSTIPLRLVGSLAPGGVPSGLIASQDRVTDPPCIPKCACNQAVTTLLPYPTPAWPGASRRGRGAADAAVEEWSRRCLCSLRENRTQGTVSQARRHCHPQWVQRPMAGRLKKSGRFTRVRFFLSMPWRPLQLGNVLTFAPPLFNRRARTIRPHSAVPRSRHSSRVCPGLPQRSWPFRVNLAPTTSPDPWPGLVWPPADAS